MKKKLFWSQYNHLFNSEKNGYLLYNAETNNVAKLSFEVYSLLKNISNDNTLTEQMDEVLLNKLIDQKVLVYDKGSYLNKRRMRYYFNAFDTSNLGLAVATTTACNFICPYCYEEGRKNFKYMSEKTEQDLLEFIRNHKRTNILNLTWYGGEPLLGFSSIQRILEGIKRINHIKLGLHNMPTNGFLLNEEKSLFFKENPMDSIQITIDGAKEHHDSQRMLQGNLPTFDTIIRNVDTFIKHNTDTKVFIRMNLSKENVHSYGPTNLMLTKYWKGKNVTVYPAYIQDLSDSCKSNCSILNSDDKIEFFTELKKTYNLNVTFEPNNKCTGVCGATRVNYYVIGPEGEMYKCWNDLGVKDCIVDYLGNKKTGNVDLATRYIAGPTMMDNPECIDCNVLPICAGGCLWVRHKKLFEGKDYGNLCCTRKNNLHKFIDLHFEEITKSMAENV